MKRSFRTLFAFAFAALLVVAPTLRAEEGMWTFDNVPLKKLMEKYHFKPTQEWLDHLRLASVRINDGGSASFISPDGLLLTNHHVARGQLQKNSNAEHDYIKNGFLALTEADELKSPDLEINVLVGLQNVTDRVQGAAKGIKDPAAAVKAREAAIAEITKESKDKTGNRSDVVSLYNGGSTGCTYIRSTRMCALCLRRKRKRRFLAATRTTLPIRAMTRIWRSSACMRTASRSTARII